MQVSTLFLGDSITEAWRGTSYGQPCSNGRCNGVPEAFRDQSLFPDSASNLVLAISGDQTQHLLWRLQNGELPITLSPRKGVILIGTNNLGAGTPVFAEVLSARLGTAERQVCLRRQ